MINIVQDTVNDVVVFLTPTKTYFLLKFVKEDTGTIKRVICTNSTTYVGAINLQLEEVSSGTEDILNGKVQLGNGGWDLYLYEQASSTNINENLATYLHHEDCYVTGTATAMSSPRCKPVQVLDGTTLTEVASGGAYTCSGGGGVCLDGTVIITDNDTPTPTTLYTEVVASGGSVNRVIQNSNININATPFTTVLAEGTKNVEVKNTLGNAVGSDNTGVWEVGDATIENSDASYSTTVKAEGIKVLPDITLTQPNGSTESKKSNVNLSCTQINALADSDLISQLTNAQVQAVIESRLTCKPVNPNFNNIHSSTLPAAVVTGDWRNQYNAGHIDNITYGVLDRVYMLSNALNLSAYTLNPFGHTKRYTGRTGSYYDEVTDTWKDKNGGSVADHATAFPNGIIYDHYTGRAWQSSINALGTGINFADTVSAATALTTNGLTWRLPTVSEHFATVAVILKINASGIQPINHYGGATGKIFTHPTGTVIAWCADVRPSDTSHNFCVRYTNTANIVLSDVRTTSRGGLAVANFTTSDLTL